MSTFLRRYSKAVVCVYILGVLLPLTIVANDDVESTRGLPVRMTLADETDESSEVDLRAPVPDADVCPQERFSDYAFTGVVRPDLWWFDANYLLMWTNGNPLPPMVTTNPSLPPRSQAGVLGVGDTEVLLGGNRVDDGGRSGVALTAGRWLDDCQDLGFQVGWFFVGDPSNDLNATWESTGVPVLARPIHNAGTSQEDAQLVAYPNVVDGSIRATTSSDLRSLEALLRGNWHRNTTDRIDVLGGYRYVRFREGVFVEEHLISRDPSGLVQIGTMIDLFDRFDTTNSFHGGEFGILTSLERGYFTFELVAKLAIGNVERRLVIDGATQVEVPGGGQSGSPGGLLALPSNMGWHVDREFALLPELNINTRLALTDQLSLNVGYNLLYLTHVLRAGQQIDRSIDTSQLPGGLPVNDNTSAGQRHPAALMDGSTLRAQSLNVGLSYVY